MRLRKDSRLRYYGTALSVKNYMKVGGALHTGSLECMVTAMFPVPYEEPYNR